MMDHKIVTEPVSFFRRIARDQLAGHWKPSVIASGIYVVIIGCVEFIMSCLQWTNVVGSIYFLLVYGAATVGVYAFFVTLIRDRTTDLSKSFEGFESFGRSFLLGFFMLLFTFLWTMLFVIPGIIASYRYSLAPMLLRDRPELSPMECINESKRLMMGNKMKKFTLDVTFIGWVLLACIPSVIVQMLVTRSADVVVINPTEIVINSLTFPWNAVVILFQVPLLWVMAYMYTAEIVFYEEVRQPVMVNVGDGFTHDFQSVASYTDPGQYSEMGGVPGGIGASEEIGDVSEEITQEESDRMAMEERSQENLEEYLDASEEAPTSESSTDSEKPDADRDDEHSQS